MHREISPRLNELGQLIGPSVGDWAVPPAPPRTEMEGTWCRVEPLSPDAHAEELHNAYAFDPQGRLWTYMSYGPFATLEDYRSWMLGFCLGDDPSFFAIRDKSGSGRAVGVASYMRILPRFGSIEVGHLCYAPALQRRSAATEAMYLMMRRAFELGYRRYEWKCDALNAASRQAALRLGFRFEGIHRQAVVYKGRSRDTAWYSILDTEWPALSRAYEPWLDPGNFDALGRQRTRLLAPAAFGGGPED